MEIGTWNGNNAVKMIEAAKFHHLSNEIEYYGFDLFESFDNFKLKEEHSKMPPSFDVVQAKLKETGARIFLYKGDTHDTLPKIIGKLPAMDFVFIDGGHSLKTIENDWRYVQKIMKQQTIVVFDDYWNVTEAGCKKLISSLNRDEFNIEVLPPKDKFRYKWGILEINLVKVTRKQRL